jgi:hypothetical protein
MKTEKEDEKQKEEEEENEKIDYKDGGGREEKSGGR